ncbi:RecQ family zinc-binding domain-containing protein, partial [Salmonella enterica subsp. enterica serovar Montevideo]|nr:RecQ family zinc-binding domain-containing protein [Salmonella enterica subsp. enterica serovar Montevideo]
AGQLQDIERHKLNAMGAFAEAQTCRRLVLLNYFGEGRQEPCGSVGEINGEMVFSISYSLNNFRFGLRPEIAILIIDLRTRLFRA